MSEDTALILSTERQDELKDMSVKVTLAMLALKSSPCCHLTLFHFSMNASLAARTRCNDVIKETQKYKKTASIQLEKENERKKCHS